ncbi:MAG: hypothetical protein JNK82_37340 [Myxococcaceae bacterium]|nr:hypothetical protein [Myxococcaceae bacterium]
MSRAPPALRVIHAVVFFGFASVTIAATHQELLQLWRAVAHPFHSGTAPHGVACAAGFAAAVTALGLAACLALGRAVPLWVSGLGLVAFLGSFSLVRHEPQQRTVPGANVKSLEQARVLHEQLNRALQVAGTVPSDAAELALESSTPFFARPFTPLRWHIEKVKRTDALPDGAQPGWLLLQIDEPSRAAFVITAVGLDDDGEPSLLRSEGKPIEYRGAYNPDMPR